VGEHRHGLGDGGEVVGLIPQGKLAGEGEEARRALGGEADTQGRGIADQAFVESQGTAPFRAAARD
jgi:hypothetical protein